MPVEEHARLGASSAHRWMECAGSPRLEATVPTPETTEYQREGTAAHNLGEQALRNTEHPASYIGRDIIVDGVAVEVTPEMAKAVAIYVAYVRGLPGRKTFEQRVSLEKLDPPESMFGTADTIAWDAETRHLEIVDYKHGEGYAVDVPGNPQLLYYLLGAVLGIGERPETMRMTVVQPRAWHTSQEKIRSADVTWDELVEFRERLMAAAHEAAQEDAPVGPVGSHCRWCDAKAVCPAQRDFAVDTARVEFDVVPPEEVDAALDGPDTLETDQLSRILKAAPIIEDWLKSVHDFVQQQLSAGQPVPGWKLVAGRRSRRWADPDAAEEWLRQRYKVADVYKKKLISPHQAEKLVSDRPRLEVPDELIHVSEGAPKLAPEESPKDEIIPGTEFFTDEDNNE